MLSITQIVMMNACTPTPPATESPLAARMLSATAVSAPRKTPSTMAYTGARIGASVGRMPRTRPMPRPTTAAAIQLIHIAPGWDSASE